MKLEPKVGDVLIYTSIEGKTHWRITEVNSLYDCRACFIRTTIKKANYQTDYIGVINPNSGGWKFAKEDNVLRLLNKIDRLEEGSQIDRGSIHFPEQ